MAAAVPRKVSSDDGGGDNGVAIANMCWHRYIRVGRTINQLQENKRRHCIDGGVVALGGPRDNVAVAALFR